MQKRRIKHNDLTHYFLRPHSELPRAYLDSCEKFFRELKNLKLARLTAANVQKKRQASSAKRQATSRKRQATSA
jgi:inorganic pyrophosphatase